jgi:uridine kinase
LTRSRQRHWQQPDRSALVQRLTDLRAEKNRAISVGISGIDCAGKSTLAEDLLGELDPALVVSGDEFTRPTSERYAEPDEGLGYYRNSFDYAWVYDTLLPAVRSGFAGELVARVSDWENDGWQEARFVVEPGAVVIVEGCFLFTGREDAFDLSIWLELPLDAAVERALRRPRDLDRMGGADGVRERYATRYLPGQALHLAHDDPAACADVVLQA